MPRVRFLRALAAASAAACLTCASAAEGNTLVVEFMFSSGAQRSAWTDLLHDFEASHPDVTVEHREVEQEAYKREFPRLVRDGPVDVAFWFAGERLRQAVDAGLLRPIDPAWLGPPGTYSPAVLDALRYRGKLWAVPLSTYPWGFFYRRSLFDRLGLAPPATWADFLGLCEHLKQAGYACTVTGGKAGWPLAAWFDLLNLRINGLDFHRRLLAGDYSFDDPRALAVFTAWRQLLTAGYLAPEPLEQGWDDALPYLYRNLAGTALLGTFAEARFPDSVRADIGFFPFPRWQAGAPLYEDAPLDVLVLPVSGRHPVQSRQFLASLSQGAALSRFAQATGTVSPQSTRGSESGAHREVAQTLDRAAGLAFFFDRDAPPKLVEAAFAAFRQFAQPPHDIAAVVRALNAARPLGDTRPPDPDSNAVGTR